MCKKILSWLTYSRRWLHLVGGTVIGVGANDWYCAIYAGTGVAGAMELKDKLWGGKWDWIDFILTALGTCLGHFLRMIIL